ncbi:unnamed protein product [Ceratitis capitata]|uniref:(Mediterranean fruit fly) hypothetical protein n=1 Tax=Ceratitis capitata TaxID=7213 RepID=A0A811UVM3_CERCA|nr:unnamed protein product [Ceratitis capitata]
MSATMLQILWVHLTNEKTSSNFYSRGKHQMKFLNIIPLILLIFPSIPPSVSEKLGYETKAEQNIILAFKSNQSLAHILTRRKTPINIQQQWLLVKTNYHTIEDDKKY